MAEYQYADFTVTWNKDMTGAPAYTAADFDTEAEVTEVLCDITRTEASSLQSGVT